MRVRTCSTLASLALSAAIVFTATSSLAVPPPVQVKPETLLKGYFFALNSGEEKRIAPLFPSKETIERSFGACAKLVDSARKHADKAGKAAAALKRAKATAKFVRLGKEKKREIFAAGKDFKGCRLQSSITLLKVRVEYEVGRPGGKTKLEGTDAKLIQLGGYWYLRKAVGIDLK